MSQSPYDYENRTGIYPISWEDFHALCKGLARVVAPFAPEIILPIGRGGYYAGTLLAHLLQVEIYPVPVSRRVNDVKTYKRPKWHLRPPKLVKGRRILVVDEICGTGETIRMVKEETQRLGAYAVKSAVLYAHSWGVTVPDYIGLVTDALILNPWDREIYKEGRFVFHPEYVEALGQQGYEADPALLIDAPEIDIFKREAT